MSDLVLTKVENNVCLITINRPDNFNSIDIETAKKLADAAEGLDAFLNKRLPLFTGL